MSVAASISTFEALDRVPPSERLACLLCHLMDNEDTAADQIVTAVFVLAHLAQQLPPVYRRAIAFRLVQHAIELDASAWN